MGGLALAAVACVVLVGQGKAKELSDLFAKSLTIMDAKGVARVVLDSHGLRLKDEAGKTRASLRVILDTPMFNLIDKAGKIRATLSLFAGRSALDLKDTTGRARVSLSVLGADGAPLLAALDAKTKIIWQAPPPK